MNAPFSPLERTDEIDLIDLWLLFKRRWQWTLLAMGLCLAAALGWGLLQKPVTTYQTSLQLGALILDGRVVPLEEPEAVKTAVEQRTAQVRPVAVEITRDSEVITLSRSGSPSQATETQALLNAQAQAILADQTRLQEAYQAQITTASTTATILFRPARVLTPAAPAGVEGPLALSMLGVLGLMLGLMLGCGAILLAEFFAAVRQRELQQADGQPLSVEAKRKQAVATPHPLRAAP